MNLDELQKELFKEYEENGYLILWSSPIGKKHQKIFDIAELGLIVTEVSEAIENIRNGQEQDLAFECADIIIRTLNFMTRKGFNAELHIKIKNKINMKRGRLHGKYV